MTESGYSSTHSNLVTSHQLHTPAALSPDKTVVYTLEPVWTQWIWREINSDHPARS